MEAAVCVQAVLRTGVGGCALIYVHTRLPVTLQLEARMAPALKGQRTEEMCQNDSEMLTFRLDQCHYLCNLMISSSSSKYFNAAPLLSTLERLHLRQCKNVAKLVKIIIL